MLKNALPLAEIQNCKIITPPITWSFWVPFLHFQTDKQTNVKQRTTGTYVQYFTSTLPGTRPCVCFPSLFYSSFGHCYAHILCVLRNPVIFVEPSPVIALWPLPAAAAAFFPTQDILNPLRSSSAPGDLVLRWTLKADTYIVYDKTIYSY